ncbi:acetate/propionate family kinase [Zavarzinia compransoris]|uniref:Acetate kinase n=1 Tax=Zavarzinia compransoris TaxID=1264899 RepID=A0A317E371_9PROT|nr:acetate/propionate family kinase [Zavarzinia compransoris]PWR19833.1 acetate kinase [Zavarzinia compransoris]TDP45059.1 acetate kinase [Zavarzinia compransoris]
MAEGIVLVLNAGSSSVKFRIAEESGTALYEGAISGIGSKPAFKLKDGAGKTIPLDLAPERMDEHQDALDLLLGIAAEFLPGRQILAAGHRVVHGGLDFAAPVIADAAVLDRLDAFVPLAPLHQPHNLAAIRALARLRPDLPQVACFDTAFHIGQDRIARLFGLPRALIDEGVFRYGFHGLSYQAIAARMPAVMGPGADGKVIVAHLGNGCSMCAMDGRRSVATTMGFTALDGLVMGTRSGAIDPGVVLYLLEQKGYTPARIADLLYRESGLLGVSGLSNDMRDLLASDAPAAAEAVALFVHRILREIGSLMMVLGGLDALVFTAGIGENAAPVRARVIEGLGFLGARLDGAANAAGGPRLTAPDSRIAAFVIPTDEEAVIVSETLRLLS